MKSNLPPANIEINGRFYPLWQQFVHQEAEWIGGALEDFGDAMDRALTPQFSGVTRITGIELRANGKDSAFFEIKGATFSCGFDVKHGGITAGASNWITFAGFGGHTFRIAKPEANR